MADNTNSTTATATKEIVLDIKHLDKKIGKKQILHDINMQVYGGEVFGFLGPNGAGKTTTIKIVVGLLTLEDGEVEIMGHTLKKDFEKALANVGGIVENPEMYKYLSGYDNLKQYARMRGIKDTKRIDEVVELVGLSNRINEKISKYSLGMRQRLGVAQALLHKPKLLILDEPTNGLDPQGIKELRDILKKVAHEEGTCVVVSSHLMSEMELMCDRVGIIANGKMIGTYTMDELVSQSTVGEVTYEIETDNPDKAYGLIDIPENKKKTDKENNVILINISAENSEEEKKTIAGIIKTLVLADVNIYSSHRLENKKLEDVFIELTGTKEGDGQIE